MIVVMGSSLTPRGWRHRVISAIGAALVIAVLAAPGASAAAPANLPGPPPGFATGIALPPPPGTGPSPVTAQPGSAIIPDPSVPGLLSGYALPHGRSVAMTLACRGRGSATLEVGTVTMTSYRCAHGRATLRFTATHALPAGRTAALLVRPRDGRPVALSVALRAAVPAYWTSVFGLGCTSAGSGGAILSAPNFTVTPATTIDVRPWLAVYTAATGWQWIGLGGPGRSAWLRFTATPSGVAEWQSAGTVNPWTWGPLTFAAGHGTSVIAAFEVVYWYGHPSDVWAYAHSSSPSPYCTYP